MSNQPENKPSFDAQLGELEAIVESLERGEISLEALMEKYERGVKLHAECQQVLRGAELRIEKLRDTENGARLEAVDLPAGPAPEETEVF
jgi:exodeoxyribonuclease VII small subunit